MSSDAHIQGARPRRQEALGRSRNGGWSTLTASAARWGPPPRRSARCVRSAPPAGPLLMTSFSLQRRFELFSQLYQRIILKKDIPRLQHDGGRRVHVRRHPDAVHGVCDQRRQQAHDRDRRDLLGQQPPPRRALGTGCCAAAAGLRAQSDTCQVWKRGSRIWRCVAAEQQRLTLLSLMWGAEAARSSGRVGGPSVLGHSRKSAR